MTPRIPTAGQMCGTLALAAFFWWVNFGLHWVNFWIGMGTAASVLALLSFWFAGVPMKRTEWTGRAVLIGLVSAALLYAIFALGNTLSGWLFRFAPHQVSAIYDIRHEGSPLAMALVLLFITSPVEEVFWRGFVQRWFMHRFGGKAGWLLAVCVYAGVHVFSGNLMLVMAALLWFVEAGRLPAWVLLVVIVREFAVTALRLIAVERGRVIAAAWSGKVKTASTMVCICLMLLIARPALDLVCAAVILVTTVYSGAEYFVKNKDVVDWSNL